MSGKLFRIQSDAVFPLWLKISATLFLSVFISVYWSYYGPINFLWFSNLGLIGAVLALWLESRLLASMMLLMTFAADFVGWDLDFLVRLLTGWHPLGATRYMFDPRIPPLHPQPFALPPVCAGAPRLDGLQVGL